MPIRYGRMLVSPFTFYRGAALIMASDLAATPRSGLTVQCCGDAHLSNFGVFASPERRLVFDVNDFDETLPGPWEWDVKRLAASMLIAARDNGFPVRPGADRARHRRGVPHRDGEFAAMRNLDVWYAHLDIENALEELGSQLQAEAGQANREGARQGPYPGQHVGVLQADARGDGEARIVDESPLIVPIDDLAKGTEREEMFDALHELLRSYRATLEYDRRVLLEQFELADFARKVVGVGSVGTRAWIALMLGRDGQDPLFLQIKEAESSVLEEFLGPSEFENHGQRVVAGQRLMQASSDIFLGWLHVESGLDGQARDFYGRQLKDWKGSAEIEQMNPKGMAAYGRLCGWTLARAHARSGDRIAIAAYLGAGPASTAPSSSSPVPMPSRTSATTRRSPRRSRQAGSPPKQASKSEIKELPDVLRTGNSARSVRGAVRAERAASHEWRWRIHAAQSRARDPHVLRPTRAHRGASHRRAVRGGLGAW